MYHSMVGNPASLPACTAAKPSRSCRSTSASSGSRWMVELYWLRSSGRQLKRGSPRSARLTLKVLPGRIHPSMRASNSLGNARLPTRWRAQEPLRGLPDAERLLQPGRVDVVADPADLFLQPLVGPPVALAEELDELAAHRLPVAAEEQVALAGGGQEVMRVAAQQRDVDAEFGDQFRRHDAEQVRAGRGLELRRLLERPLGARSAADRVLFLDEMDAQAGARQEGGGDEPVVAGADDDDVAFCGAHGGE